MHKHVALKHSAFFTAAMSSSSKEAHDGIICLPESKASAFEDYMHWLYRDEVLVLNPDDIHDHEQKTGGRRFTKLTELYVQAITLQDQGLRDAVITTMLEVSDETGTTPGIVSVEVAYSSAPEDCMLRRLLLDYFTAYHDTAWLARQNNAARLPATFLYELVYHRMANHRLTILKPTRADRCHYHEHDAAAPCSD